MLNYEANSETIESIKEINAKIKEESNKESSDKNKITKLMFEQLLRGLKLNT